MFLIKIGLKKLFVVFSLYRFLDAAGPNGAGGGQLEKVQSALPLGESGTVDRQDRGDTPAINACESTALQDPRSSMFFSCRSPPARRGYGVAPGAKRG